MCERERERREREEREVEISRERERERLVHTKRGVRGPGESHREI